MSLFHFSSHTLHLFCLFAPICFLFSLLFYLFIYFYYYFFFWFSLRFLFLFFIFFVLARPKSLLPFTTYSLWLTEPTITNASILSLTEPTLPLLSLTQPKNPVLKPIFSSQNRRFKGGEGRIRLKLHGYIRFWFGLGILWVLYCWVYLQILTWRMHRNCLMKCVKKDVISWTMIITGYVQNEEAKVGYEQNDSVFIFFAALPFSYCAFYCYLWDFRIC